MKSLKEFITEQLENSNQSLIQEEQTPETASTNIQEAEQPTSEETTVE
jgi:hypothetical protein